MVELAYFYVFTICHQEREAPHTLPIIIAAEAFMDAALKWSPADLRITAAQALRLRGGAPITHWSEALAERTERSLSERRMLHWRGQRVVANAKGQAALDAFDRRRLHPRNTTRRT